MPEDGETLRSPRQSTGGATEPHSGAGAGPNAGDGLISLPRSAPGVHGVSAGGIIDFLDAVERAGIEMHSLMVVRHGHVVAQGWWAPYAANRRQLVYSLSKSFTSLAAGIACGEGALDLDDRVVDLVGDSVPDDVDDRFQRLLVRHVLSMATGHERDPIDLDVRAADPDLLRVFFATPPEREPGSLFAYNQLATYAVARIVEQHAGTRLLDYLRPRLFEPLGIEEAAWMHLDGHDLGFSGLHVRTESIAKLGQLVLQGGRWGARQIVPARWVTEATRLQQRNDPPEFAIEGEGPSDPPEWQLGYGFQFWMGRHGFRGDGAYGQLCLVWPQEDVVVAITACTTSMDVELDLAYRHLLPAVQGRAGTSGPGDAELARRLAGLAVPLPADEGGRASGTFTRAGSRDGLSGRAEGAAPGLQQLTLTPDDSGWMCRLRIGEAEGELPVGRGAWREGVWPIGGVPFVSAGGVRADGVFEAQLRMIETPHHLVLTVDPHDGRLGDGTFSIRWNEPPLHGPDPAWHSVT